MSRSLQPLLSSSELFTTHAIRVRRQSTLLLTQTIHASTQHKQQLYVLSLSLPSLPICVLLVGERKLPSDISLSLSLARASANWTLVVWYLEPKKKNGRLEASHSKLSWLPSFKVSIFRRKKNSVHLNSALEKKPAQTNNEQTSNSSSVLGFDDGVGASCELSHLVCY